MSTENFPPDSEAPFLEHLKEVRDRLMKAVGAILLIFICLFPFADDIYGYLAQPLLQTIVGDDVAMEALPKDGEAQPGVDATGREPMISIGVIDPFLVPVKTVLFLSIFIGIPILLYHAWAFISPGLYQHEKKLAFPLVFSSTVLFYLGMAFSYFVVFPLVFGFLQSIAPEGVSVMPDINSYLNFAIKMFFAFGIAFEVPIATILIIKLGMTTADSLREKRPYVFVGAFVVGMLLTPPDIISQTLLAIPIWLLFEAGIVFSKYFISEEEPQAADEENSDSAEHNSDIH